LKTHEEEGTMGEEALILETNFMGQRKKIDIKDGKAVIDDKEFIVDRVQPFMIKQKRLGRTTIKPFYILKWDKVEPVNYMIEETEIDGERYAELRDKAILKSIVVAFPEKGEKDVLPHYLRETHDMSFLKHMKKYAADGAGRKFEFKRWMLVPIAFLISGSVVFLLYYTHIFK
jgi:hypothetical protein